MELGRVAEIENAKTNHIEKIESVQEVDNNQKVIDEEQYKKALGSSQDEGVTEVPLDNVKFGYNKDSKDLYVKVTRDGVERQYPTEDMMKMKAQLLTNTEKTQID